MTTNYNKMLSARGYSEVVICTILSGWTIDAIEALIRGEAEYVALVPTQEGIANEISALVSLD